MKKIQSILKGLIAMLCMVGIVTLNSCKDRPELDEPGSKLEGINATWEMVEVMQVDIASLAQKPLDVSKAFVGTNPMKIKFNASDFTYTVTKGSAPNYFGASGKWAFDDNEFPTKITLTTNLGETKDLPLVRTIRPVDAYLNFSYSRTCANEDAPYISYQFKFIRSN